MHELVTDHIHRHGEAVEELFVAVPEHHLDAVPERVRVVLVEVDRPQQGHPRSVDRVAVERLGEQVVGRAQTVVGLVGRRVARLRVTFGSDQDSRQVLGVLGVRDDPVRALGLDPCRAAEGERRWSEPGRSRDGAGKPNGLVQQQCRASRAPLSLVPVEGDLLEKVRRQDALAWAMRSGGPSVSGSFP